MIIITLDFLPRQIFGTQTAAIFQLRQIELFKAAWQDLVTFRFIDKQITDLSQHLRCRRDYTDLNNSNRIQCFSYSVKTVSI